MRKRAGILILVQMIAVIGGLWLVFLFLQSENTEGISYMFSYLCGIVPLLLLLVIALPPMLVHGIWKDFLRVFQLGNKNRKLSICEIKKTLLAIELLQRQIIYGTIMIFATHIVSDVEDIADRVMILAHGKIRFNEYTAI